MKFFLDNMISHRFAEALRALGKDVVALREEFPQNTTDTTWLAELGGHGWALVTVDRHIRSRPLERAALRDAQITAFFLCPFWSKLPYWDQAVWIVRRWPKFELIAATLTRGTHVNVQQNGTMRPLPPV